MIYLDDAASSPPWPEAVRTVCESMQMQFGNPGAACAARDPRPSHVLLAMGYSEQRARQSVRFSLGRMTTMEEISKTVQAVKRICNKDRGPGQERSLG